MVGSVSSRMPLRRRLTNTAATRGRSRGQRRSPSRRWRPGSPPPPASRTAGPAARLAHSSASSLSAASIIRCEHRGAVLAALDLIGLGQERAFRRRRRPSPVSTGLARSGCRPPVPRSSPRGWSRSGAPPCRRRMSSRTGAIEARGGELVFAGLQLRRRAGELGGGHEQRRPSGSRRPAPASRRSRDRPAPLAQDHDGRRRPSRAVGPGA